MISALWHKSKFNFKFFLNIIQIFRFPCCSTHEDLSIDVSITNVWLILTKPRRFLFSGYGHSGYGQNSNSTILNFFEKKNQIFGFPCCNTREDLSIDVSITNVGLILTKPWWFLFSGFRHNSISTIKNFFYFFLNFLGVHNVVLVKTFPLMYQLLM